MDIDNADNNDNNSSSNFKARAQAHFRSINSETGQGGSAPEHGRKRRLSETEEPQAQPLSTVKKSTPWGSKPPREPKAKRSAQDQTKTDDGSQPKAKNERERRVPAPKDGSELAELPREEAYKRVFSHAGRLVSMKDWSRKGLAERLGERFKKSPDGAALAAEAAARMEAIGAIEDARYARGFLRSRLAKKSLSSALRELSQHGVGKEDAQLALEALREEGLVAEPADQAWTVWRKKFDRYPADERERAKQARHMASRGFSYDAISRVWAKAKNGMDESDD